MTSIPEGGPASLRYFSAAAWKELHAERWLPLALVLAIAILVRHLVVANTDVSWLITLSEKVLDGQRLYIDLIEINPPASIFLYLPLVALARALALQPEATIDGAVFLAISGSLWLAGRTLRQARQLEGLDGMRLAVLVAVVLAILPAQTFGEREHIAVILLLPLFAVWSSRLAGARPDIFAVFAAGVGAGVTLAIKPHFALGLVPALIVLSFRTKSWHAFFQLENWIAATLAIGYGISVLIFFPAFVSDVMPMVIATYLPVRHSLFVLLVYCPVVLVSALQLRLASSWWPGLLRLPAITMLLAAASGFLVTFLLQGKGWPYHSYPTLAVVYLIVAIALSGNAVSVSSRRPIDTTALMTGMAAVACATFYWMNLADGVAVWNEPIRRLASHPRLLIMSSDPSVGHPLVRQIGGTWVSRVGSLWITAGVITRQKQEVLDAATTGKLAGYAERDRAMLEQDIRRNRPDVILVDRVAFDWDAWARADQGLAEQLAAYRIADSSPEYVILQRRAQ